MHLRDRAVLHKAPRTNERNDVQAKFAMGQCPASFFFGVIAHVILRAGGGMTLTDNYSELENALLGHDLPPAVIRDP